MEVKIHVYDGPKWTIFCWQLFPYGRIIDILSVHERSQEAKE